MHLLQSDSTINILSKQNEYKNQIDEMLNKYIESIQPESMRQYIKDALFPGRRLRSFLLMILCQDTIGSNELCLLCTAIELCHRSSIILDDMIDLDSIRRNVPAFYTKHGNATTVLLSHYMISEAYKVFDKLPEKYSRKISSSFSTAYNQITYGELGDIGSLDSCNYLQLYRDSILHKTSSAFELVFHWFSILTDSNKAESDLLIKIGRSIGDMYQIYNDVYDDIAASDDERGKKTFNKINLSLFVCLLLDISDDELRLKLFSYIKNGCNTSEYREIKSLLRSPILESKANEIAAEADLNLNALTAQCGNRQVQDVVFAFSKWLKQERCWDQNEFKNAGY